MNPIAVRCPRCHARPGFWCQFRLNKDRTVTKRRLCHKRLKAAQREGVTP